MRFTILGPPRTKKNHQRIGRVRGRPVIFQARTAEGWEEIAVIQLRAVWKLRPPCPTPVAMRAMVYREKDTGDLGNYLAAICDALERAGIVENDRLIQSFDGSRLRLDRENPRVEIDLEAMA